MTEPRQDTWERVWRDRHDVAAAYDNDDRIRRHLERVTPLDGARILEVGAGTGRDAMSLASHGARVVAVDYTVASLDLLRRSPVDGVVGADAFDLPFPDATFDVVYHQGLLEHFREARAETLLRENVRVLRPGGFLLVDVPQRWHPYTAIKHALMAADRWFAGWERSFSMRELHTVLHGLGLAVVSDYGEWMYPSLGYRVVRETAKRRGHSLPLRPSVGGPLAALRGRARSALVEAGVTRWTGASIGVIARAP
jgi:ubiquinone/menaquinone biosynthesis C-methylase UbiE